MIGGWVRYAGALMDPGPGRISMMFLGQAIAGVAQPFFLNSPTKIAYELFPAKCRGLANSIMTLSNPRTKLF